MKMNQISRGLATIIIGIVITIFLWWFFGGFSFWLVPGFAVLFIGVAELFYTAYRVNTERKSPMLHAGLLILFIGVAGYLGFASHVVLGTLQAIFLVVTMLGIILAAFGIATAHRT